MLPGGACCSMGGGDACRNRCFSSCSAVASAHVGTLAHPLPLACVWHMAVANALALLMMHTMLTPPLINQRRAGPSAFSADVPPTAFAAFARSYLVRASYAPTTICGGDRQETRSVLRPRNLHCRSCHCAIECAPCQATGTLTTPAQACEHTADVQGCDK